VSRAAQHHVASDYGYEITCASCGAEFCGPEMHRFGDWRVFEGDTTACTECGALLVHSDTDVNNEGTSAVYTWTLAKPTNAAPVALTGHLVGDGAQEVPQPSAPYPALASETQGRVSTKVQQLHIRRVGGLVYADLPSLRVDGERVTIENTCKEFERHWNQATWEMTSEERAEANARLEALDEEATVFAWRTARTQESTDYTGALDRLAARLSELEAIHAR